jgi:hypothetical protein
MQFGYGSGFCSGHCIAFGGVLPDWGINAAHLLNVAVNALTFYIGSLIRVAVGVCLLIVLLFS